jgi:hypothetical protein
VPAGGTFCPTFGVFLIGKNPDNRNVAPERSVDLGPYQLVPSTRLILLLPGVPLGQNAFKRNRIRHSGRHVRCRWTAIAPHVKRAAPKVQFPSDKATGKPVTDD